MEFLKKHYEKIILSLVLLLLAAAAAMMPILVSKQREEEEQRRSELLRPKVKPMDPIDLSTNEVTLKRVQTPVNFALICEHNLFNPVRWQQKADGTLIKIQTGKEVGLAAMVVTAINPLYLTVTFDEATGTGDNIKYTLTVVRETAAPQNRKTTRQMVPMSENSTLAIKSVQGPMENPSSVTVQVKPERDTVAITKEKPFSKVIGFSADLRYDPENLTRKGLRKGDTVVVGGEIYNIVAIEQDEVVFSAKSNQKQTSVKLRAASK